MPQENSSDPTNDARASTMVQDDDATSTADATQSTTSSLRKPMRRNAEAREEQEERITQLQASVNSLDTQLKIMYRLKECCPGQASVTDDEVIASRKRKRDRVLRELKELTEAGTGRQT
ncbi:hypothetical protein D9758_005178 [Tetrapyrgos nigripes]|uniref:Uncharacterized protein n=1 Tax=Tetrapyrgos nigripes TaxID=182062 RepID=A0A8H5GWY9_9AGAR|nr:hypothetical protein D9758_005178 [Tetrapyrgos nigripes]